MLPNNPTQEEMEKFGARVEYHNDGHVINDCFYVSGSIPRMTSFEKGMPGHFSRLPDGKNWVQDEDIMDERYVAVKIKGRGTVVFSACSHAGIINVCNDVVKKLDSKLVGVVGGFHLAGRSVEGKIQDTIDRLKEFDPEIILAGHCTGWRAKAKLQQEFEYTFQPLSVGGKFPVYVCD
jgi:7,8-dihydropterin-6-yl-methyl-4-(beta-D-ribofuranosyl)aminobenzene 5'-phosphate synthase